MGQEPPANVCRIGKLAGQSTSRDFDTGTETIRCWRRGAYRITEEAVLEVWPIPFPELDRPNASGDAGEAKRANKALAADAAGLPQSLLLLGLSAHARGQAETGRVVVLTHDNWRDVAEPHLETTVQERAGKLLSA